MQKKIQMKIHFLLVQEAGIMNIFLFYKIAPINSEDIRITLYYFKFRNQNFPFSGKISPPGNHEGLWYLPQEIFQNTFLEGTRGARGHQPVWLHSHKNFSTAAWSSTSLTKNWKCLITILK